MTGRDAQNDSRSALTVPTGCMRAGNRGVERRGCRRCTMLWPCVVCASERARTEVGFGVVK